jgi:hypothetical protein
MWYTWRRDPSTIRQLTLLPVRSASRLTETVQNMYSVPNIQRVSADTRVRLHVKCPALLSGFNRNWDKFNHFQ